MRAGESSRERHLVVLLDDADAMDTIRSASPPTRSPRRAGGDEAAPAAGADAVRQLWVDKHTPSTREALAVATKKVEEVAGWLQFACAPHAVNRALLLTGACPSAPRKRTPACPLRIAAQHYRKSRS
jgi:hypothetical protein